jgi:hypothetical protein
MEVWFAVKVFLLAQSGNARRKAFVVRYQVFIGANRKRDSIGIRPVRPIVVFRDKNTVSVFDMPFVPDCNEDGFLSVFHCEATLMDVWFAVNCFYSSIAA